MMKEPAPLYHGHRARLKERFSQSRGVGIPDYELLELLLFYLYPRRDVKGTAKKVLSHFGSLSAMLHGGEEQWESLEEATPSLIFFSSVLKDLLLRVAREEVADRPLLNQWEKIISYGRLQSGFSPREQFRVLYLDRKYQLIADEMQQEGTFDHAVVYPREIIRRALGFGAMGIILMHNHPSGDTTPSAADISLTEKLIEIGQSLQIKVLDHIIIGRSQHFSMKSSGII